MEIKTDKSNEINKSSSFSNNSFNPDKRLDVNQRNEQKSMSGYNVDNRVETKSNDVKTAYKNYMDDLKSKSPCPDTIRSGNIDPSKFERQPPDVVAKAREDFNDNKAQYRRDWEKAHNQEWPKYQTDILNSDGKVIRRAGDNYDAHHKQPLCLGGENKASNITPMDFRDHMKIHSAEGSCTKLVKSVGGN